MSCVCVSVSYIVVHVCACACMCGLQSAGLLLLRSALRILLVKHVLMMRRARRSCSRALITERSVSVLVTYSHTED